MACKEVGLQPTSATSHSHLAVCLLEIDRPAEAQEEGRKALDLLTSDPTDMYYHLDRCNVATTHNLLGLHLERLGRRKEARAAWTIAADLSADLELIRPSETARQYLKDFPDL